MPARPPACYHPEASPFLLSLMLLAIKPLIGNKVKVAATCDINTMTESNVAPFCVNGMKQIKSNEAVVTNKPIPYHFRKLSDISTIGPHKKRQRFAERPMATMPAVSATGKPFLVNKNGRATVTKPWLIPDGIIRKKI